MATDTVGNASTSTLTDVDQVDLTAPTVAATQSATGGWNVSTSDTITGTAADTGGSSLASVAIYDNGTSLGAAR